MSVTYLKKYYKYQSSLNFLINYLEQKIWFSSLSSFNDPFEGLFTVTPNSPETILADPELFEKTLHFFHDNGSPEMSKEALIQLLKQPEFKVALDNAPPLSAPSFFKEHGALCVTTKNDNIPMWAYYGNQHKGYCLELELDFSYILAHSKISPLKLEAFIEGVQEGNDIISFTLDDSDLAFVFTRVAYSSAVPNLNSDEFRRREDQYSRTEYMVKNSIGVKFEQWKHEDEYRLISNYNSSECGLLSLTKIVPFLKVTGVIMGFNIDASHEKQIREQCKKHNIKIYKASLSKVAYTVEINECLNYEETLIEELR